MTSTPHDSRIAEQESGDQEMNRTPAIDRTLIAVYEAALTVASELRLDVVLQRIADLARELVPARYAALGVADERGRIQRFVTSGITADERAAIGPIPRGHGLLAALIEEGQPLLVPDIAADPRSFGFPEHHPPMRSLLGVPITLGDRTLGDLYLTERLGQPVFDTADLAALEALAAHAATAIDRAQLYQGIERQRREAEQQRDDLRVILDTLPSAVLIRHGDGEIELANAAAVEMIVGPPAAPDTLPREGRDFRLLQTDGAPLPEEQRPETRALAGETVRNRQLLVRRADGKSFPVLVQSAPLGDGQLGLERVVVVLQDVTRLREAEQLREDFLSLVSHEFRTPLATVNGGAYLLANQGDRLDDETRSALLADIVVESERLDRMLTNMLSVTAIQAGQIVPETEPVLIDSLARRVATRVGGRNPAHRFTVDVPAGLPPVEADEDLLEQVFVNLYENAVKYAPGGGSIATSACRTGAVIEIQVTDTGVGVAAGDEARIFERFRRVGSDQTVRGMGLGLYLSRHLVEAQGGRISATSPGIGQGATFVITMPIAEGWSEGDGDTSA